MQRPRAIPDLRFVFHPETDASYRHFDGHEAVPFAPAATAVTRANAWWLAEAALLAYWDPDEARQRFAAAGLAAELVESGDTQAYVASMAGAVIVAFRGTEQDQLGDAFDDARFGLVHATHGSVHEGFRDALDRVWPAMESLYEGGRPPIPAWHAAEPGSIAAARAPSLSVPDGPRP